MKTWPDPIHEAYLKLRLAQLGKRWWPDRVSKKKCRELARREVSTKEKR
jgi:hypothetical protein